MYRSAVESQKTLGFDRHRTPSGHGFAAQILHLTCGGGTDSAARQVAFGWLHLLLRPGIIQALRDPFVAAQLGNAVLAAQPVESDAALSSAEKCLRVRRRMSFTTAT
jgi:hypothetical protein